MDLQFESEITMLTAPTTLTGNAGFGPMVKRWNVDEYHRMIELGLLREGAPIELIDGMLVYKDRGESGGRPMVQGSRHHLAVAQLVQLNAVLDRLGFHIRIQSSISISPNHEPEPDGVVLPGKPADYRRLPTSRDAALVIEVADSSLEYDRTVKKQMYATAAIPMYWIVNLRQNVVEVYEEPDLLEARYLRHQDFAVGARLPLQLGTASLVEIAVVQLIADAQ
jgi:Uma2 family endonuclease